MHGQLATLLGDPGFQLKPAEASGLAKAAAEVAKHYPTAALSPKTAAWLALGQAAAVVYAPRIWALASKRKQARANRAAVAAQQAQADALASGGLINPNAHEYGATFAAG